MDMVAEVLSRRAKRDSAIRINLDSLTEGKKVVVMLDGIEYVLDKSKVHKFLSSVEKR